MLFLLLWQVVASGYAVISLKAAASDGAQVYAVSGDEMEAKAVIYEAIGSSSILQVYEPDIDPIGNGLFVVNVSAKHPLVFLPDSIANLASITIDSKATGKVLVP
ncbi:pilus assembly protein [Ureibacillus sp. GCM10028918]